VRTVRWLPALALVLCSPLSALAASADETTISASSAREAASRPPSKLGLMVDAGLPDGANASLVFRPLSWLRAHAGGGYNMISPGVRAGVTVIPFGWGPSATVEAGRYFEGNANGVAQRVAGSGFHSGVLERVGYDYANAHLGLDFGSRAFTFYIHAGMSYARAKVHNLDGALSTTQASTDPSSGSTEITVPQDPTVRAWFPSAKLGLVVYFL
jgi:hypothetical protein